jgi:hypothetical protein
MSALEFFFVGIKRIARQFVHADEISGNGILFFDQHIREEQSSLVSVGTV